MHVLLMKPTCTKSLNGVSCFCVGRHKRVYLLLKKKRYCEMISQLASAILTLATCPLFSWFGRVQDRGLPF